jgi:hypothetical protein
MQVLHVEGLASHDGPESCVGLREGVGEALAGEHAGRVSSREMLKVQGADAVEKSGRQHETARDGERRPALRGPQTSRTRGSHLHGNRDIHWPAVGERPSRTVRIGKDAPVIR